MKKIITAFMIVILFWVMSTMAQTPGDTIWTRAYGGAGMDFAREIQSTIDGGYIAAGDYEMVDYWTNGTYLLRLNSSGDTLWTRLFCNGGYNSGFSILETPDGGFIHAGRTSIMGENGHPYIMKIDSNGDSLWARLYSDSSEGQADCIRQTNDGGFIISGLIDSMLAGGQRGYIVKIDSGGQQQWSSIYGDGVREIIAIEQSSDGGYIMVGSGGLMGHANFSLIKTDSLGIPLWTTLFDTLDGVLGNAVVEVESGYIVVGSIWSRIYQCNDAFLFKTDLDGNQIWAKSYGHLTGNEQIFSIRRHPDGGFIAAGSTDYGMDGYSDAWLLMLDANCDTLWTRTYGTAGYEIANSVRMTSNGNFILAGSQSTDTTWSDAYFVYISSTTPGCSYVPGDINGNGTPNGIDVVFGVNYFKGISTPPINCSPFCPNQPAPFYAAGDVNGNCSFNGIDVTFFVRYLKGQARALLYCADCPPASTIIQR